MTDGVAVAVVMVLMPAAARERQGTLLPIKPSFGRRCVTLSNELPSIKAGALLSGNSFDNVTHRSEEHTSELQSHSDLVCRLLLEKKTTPISTLVSQLSTIPSSPGIIGRDPGS